MGRMARLDVRIWGSLIQPVARCIAPFRWTLMNSTLSLYSLHERIWHWLQAAGHDLPHPHRDGHPLSRPVRNIGIYGERGSLALADRICFDPERLPRDLLSPDSGKVSAFSAPNGRLHAGQRFARRVSIFTASSREKNTRSMLIPGANSTHCRRSPTFCC